MAYKIIHAKKELRDLVLNQYVNIQSPDTYDEDNPRYKFSTDLEGELAEKLIAAIDGNMESAAAEMGCKPDKKRPYKRNDDGTVTFNFSIRQFEEGVRPFKVWDMGMRPIEDVPNLTGGTVINLNFAFYVSEYKRKAYISLQPTHIQIKKAEIYEGAGSAPTFGAGEGYESSDEAAPSFNSGAGSDESNAEYADF